MSTGRRIRHLAARCGVSVDTALARVQAQSLPYTNPEQLVSTTLLPAVLAAIGDQPAPTTPGRAEQPTPEVVAQRYNKPAKTRVDHPQRPLRHQYDWPIVGNAPRQPISYLTHELVEKIHMKLVVDFSTSGDPIEPAGVRDRGELLASALGRPKTSLGDVLKYPTIEMASAALLHAIIHNHPFHNGNKRTAIVAFLVFLDNNGYVLTSTDDELFDYVLALAAHEQADVNDALSISDRETVSAAKWVALHSRKTSNLERTLQWRKLETILRRYGCSIENRDGNSVAIKLGHLTSHVGRRNDGAELDGYTIGKIRKELKLDDQHGIDSQVFYYDDDVIPQFINKYRKILTKLAAY